MRWDSDPLKHQCTCLRLQSRIICTLKQAAFVRQISPVMHIRMSMLCILQLQIPTAIMTACRAGLYIKGRASLHTLQHLHLTQRIEHSTVSLTTLCCRSAASGVGPFQRPWR